MTEIVVAVDVEFESLAVAAAGSGPGAEIVRRPADAVELLSIAAAGVGDVVLLSPHFPGVDADVVARLRAHGMPIVGLGDGGEPLTRWGVEHIVSPWAAGEEYSAAISAALESDPQPAHAEADAEAGSPPRSPSAPTRSGEVIAVWGTGSSPGRSAVAVVLAHQLARAGEKTILVDADTVAASLAIRLGVLDDAPQIAALCRRSAGPGLGAEDIAECLTPIDRGLRLVTGLPRADRWPEVRGGVLVDVLDALAGEATVVVDVSDRIDPDDPFADPHYDRHQATRAVLDRADRTVIVAAADPVGLPRLVRLLESDRGAGLRERAVIVVNRVRESAVGPDPEARIAGVLARFAGVDDAVLLPDDPAVLDRALLDGRSPVETAPRSPFCTAVAERLLPRMPGAPAVGERTRRRRGRRMRD